MAKCLYAGVWPNGSPRLGVCLPRQARAAVLTFTRLELVVVVRIVSNSGMIGALGYLRHDQTHLRIP